MYGKAYSVCPSGIFVAPGSAYQQPADLAGVQVSVGYHSGSHYSAIQGLEPFLGRDDIALHHGRERCADQLSIQPGADAVQLCAASQR